jgi:hypothetical protein
MDALNALDDITIPSLLGLAQEFNVSEEDLTKTETNILILSRHLEAITGQSWADTWNGLKSRFANYLAEIE